MKREDLELLEAKIEAVERLLEAVMEKCVEVEQSVKELAMLLELKSERCNNRELE